MKNIFTVAIVFVSLCANSQGSSTRNLEAASASLTQLIQVLNNQKALRNIETESLITTIINKKFCLLVNQKDTIVLHEIEVPEIPASEIKRFDVKNASFYYVSWTEKSHVADSLKTEEITTQRSVICDLKMKKPIMTNFYKTTFISEIVFLNNTQASETREKIRKEGFECILNPDGSIILSNSNQKDRMIYDENLGKFVYANN